MALNKDEVRNCVARVCLKKGADKKKKKKKKKDQSSSAMASIRFTSTWSSPDDVVNAQNHFSSLGGGHQHLTFDDKRLGYSKLQHTVHLTNIHICNYKIK